MHPLERFSNLVLAVQQAGLEPHRWRDAVRAIVRELGASDGILYSPHAPPSHGGFWASASLLPEQMESYAAYYVHKDVWREAYPESLSTSGLVVSGDRLITPRQMRRTEFYNDFCQPLGIGRLLCGIVLPDHSRTVAGGINLSLFRPLTTSGFEAEKLRFLRLLMPHLQAAVETSYALGFETRKAALAEASLDRVSFAAVIVDRDARVLFANAVALATFRLNDGVSTSKGCLVGKTKADTAALQRFIATLLAPPGGMAIPAVHTVSRASGRRSYVCFGQPVRSESSEIAGCSPGAAAILFIRDPDVTVNVDLNVLAALFRLTRAEAAIGAGIAGGASLVEAAAERGISYETARSQLKSVFSKTGCASQAELAALLASIVPP